MKLMLAVAAIGLTCANATAVKPPRLTHLFTAKVTASTGIVIGTELTGTRTAYPITGGNFTGPALNGTVLPVGADFSLMTPDKLFCPNGVSILHTDDGANILFRDVGCQSGEFVYGSATFETGSKKYAWLNTAVVVTRAKVATGDTSTDVGLEVFLVN